MTSKIIIENFITQSTIGIHDYEREAPQELIINLTVDYDFSDAIKFDDIKHTIDYAKLSQDLDNYIKKSKFFLLETLAHHCIELIFKTTIGTRALIEIKKYHVVESIDAVGVSMERTRDS